MRHTPYATNDDDAKDYELDRLERNQDIMDSEQLHPSYEAPCCGEWIKILPTAKTVRCKGCGEMLRLEVDAEFTDGMWRDRSKLVTAGSHWDEAT